MPKERDLLLQEDVDAAEENLIDRAIFFVHPDRGVEREQGHVPTERGETGRECIIPQAAAAIHAAGTGGDVDYSGLRFHSIYLSRITPVGHHRGIVSRSLSYLSRQRCLLPDEIRAANRKDRDRLSL